MGAISPSFIRVDFSSHNFILHTSVAAAADDGVQATLDHPVEVAQKAAVNALTVIGCTIKKEDPTYVEGKREHRSACLWVPEARR